MIQDYELIHDFQLMYTQHWRYVWGKAEKGCVDCSGAFTYAYSQYGLKIPHGCNAIARRYIRGKMLPISMAQPGMAAFKARNPGEEGYKLPDKYKPGGPDYNGDLTDYYHIGLVDDDPRYVLNAKGEKSGFCRDKLTTGNGWDFVAYLKDVNYEEDEETMTATVVLPTGAGGNTVNLREGSNKNYAIIARVPVGATVEVIRDDGQWCEVGYSGKVGWMMSNYLEYAGQGGESGGDVITDAERLTIETALQEIEEQIETIRSALGRG